MAEGVNDLENIVNEQDENWDLEKLEPITETMTVREIKFCHEFMKDGSWKAAGRRAGYSEGSLVTLQDNLSKRERVMKYLKELRDQYAAKSMLTMNRLTLEYSRIAFYDPVEVYEELINAGAKEVQGTAGGVTINIGGLTLIPKNLRHAIRSIKPTKHGIEVQFHDKLAALEGLGKHIGYFEEDNRQRAAQAGLGQVAIVLPDNGRGDIQDNVTPTDEDIQSF